MRRLKVGFLAKCLLFTIIVSTCIFTINHIMMPKYYYNNDWPVTNTYSEFYNLDKNTVDVLFLGTSHAVSSFNPQVIYDEYGIRSYNLGSEQQSIVVSYYWLEEALKYQSPKVVVFDTYSLHKYIDAYSYNKLNCSEMAIRKAIDNMKFSKVKIAAVKDICALDSSQDMLSYYLTNIRYHSRWTRLDENDFIASEMNKHGGIKGYSAFGGIMKDADTIVFSEADVTSAESEPMIDIAEEYLAKMQRLCEDNDAKLILVKIPSGESKEKHKATKDYAEAHGLSFYDFNEVNLYNEIGYNVETDKYNHPSYLGAEKISKYIGSLLLNQYGITPQEDSSFLKSGQVYMHAIKNIQLNEIDNAVEYVDAITDSNYDLFVFIPDNVGENLDEAFIERWTKLGFTSSIDKATNGVMYCAVKTDQVEERMSNDSFHLEGLTSNKAASYQLAVDASNMLQHDYSFLMTIDNVECANYKKGINIVVYDNDYRKIVDKVNIDTTVPEMTLSRY